MMASPKKSPLPADTRERILAAARELFAEHGAGGVTMAEVAVAADVSRATVFNQFGSKHALVEAITEGVFADYEAILDRALADKRTPTPVLVRALFELMGTGIETDASFYRAAFREISRMSVGLEEGGTAESARIRATERLAHLLTRGQARGELGSDYDPDDLAAAFDSLVFGTITHWLFGSDHAARPLTERMRRAASIFLGPVMVAPERRYTGPAPDLSPPGRSPGR